MLIWRPYECEIRGDDAGDDRMDGDDAGESNGRGSRAMQMWGG
jgi:hypothetical protein